MLKTQHEERRIKTGAFQADLVGAGVFWRGWEPVCIDHGVSEEGVRASASNSSTDCYEGPCVSIHPTTL